MPQISRGKFDCLRRATAGFTTSAFDGYGLRSHLPARPAPYASDPVLVHRLASLLHASFRPRLAASVISPLRFAITSRPSRCEEDFHLQTVKHCSAHRKGPLRLASGSSPASGFKSIGLFVAPQHQGDQFRLDDPRWPRLHTYAASADTWSGVSCAPPIAGMGLRYFFGCDTPSLIVFLIPA